MSILKENEKKHFIELCNNCDGSIYNFAGLTNERFRQFVNKSIGIDMYGEKYASYPSKNKKILFIMDNFEDKIVGKLMLELLQHLHNSNYINDEKLASFNEFVAIAQKLIGKDITKPKIKETPTIAKKNFDSEKHLKSIYELVRQEDTPQIRGFLFQDFLNSFFEDCGFKPRKSFIVNGNQIDGSIEVDHEIYLVEAKWQKKPSGIDELVKFDSIVKKQSGITRGIFVSFSGFVESQLQNFRIGTDPRFFLIQGKDITLSLERKENFYDIFNKKLRAFAEGKILI